MANIVGIVVSKEQWIYSSSFTKTANLGFNGRGASIFRINTNCCVNP